MKEHRREGTTSSSSSSSSTSRSTSVTKWKVEGGRLLPAPSMDKAATPEEEGEEEEELEDSCAECGMAFLTTDLLDTHLEEIHGNKRKNNFV